MKPTPEPPTAIEHMTNRLWQHPIKVLHIERQYAMFEDLQPQALHKEVPEVSKPTIRPKPATDNLAPSTARKPQFNYSSSTPKAERIKAVDLADPKAVEQVLARGWRRV